MSQAALKNIKVSIRLTEEEYAFIDQMNGKNFSDKLCDFIDSEMNRDTQTERIEKKLDMLLELFPAHAPGEVIEDKYRFIAAEIKRNGFRPTKELVVRIHQLNALTHQENTLQDIEHMSRFPRENDKENELVKDIIKEFKLQEMERVP